MVTASGRPSGTATTTMVTAIMKAWRTTSWRGRRSSDGWGRRKGRKGKERQGGRAVVSVCFYFLPALLPSLPPSLPPFFCGKACTYIWLEVPAAHDGDEGQEGRAHAHIPKGRREGWREGGREGGKEVMSHEAEKEKEGGKAGGQAGGREGVRTR